MENILVTGIPRSGTTWIGKTISQHESIIYVHEPFNRQYPNKKIPLALRNNYTYAPLSDQKEEIVKAMDSLFKHKNFAILREIKSIDEKEKRYKNQMSYTMEPMFENLRILMKDPLALLSAGWLYENYNLKVIITIRNPIGFVASLKKAGWQPNLSNFWNQMQLMNTWLKSYKDKVEELSRPDSDFLKKACLLWNICHYVVKDYQKLYPEWLFIKHEDIIMNPVRFFNNIFSYLGLSMSNSIFKYIEDYTNINNPVEATSHMYQRRNSKEIYKNQDRYISQQEKEVISLRTEYLAKHFGYM